MNQKDFVRQMSGYLKLIRSEFGFSQEQMSAILGISKKTLVETEKGRRLLSWTECAALASIFAGSTVLRNAFGGELSDLIPAIAFEHTEVKYPMTMGGKVWWRNVLEKDGYRIQQNIVSGHYRLLDSHNGRIMSSFDFEQVKEYLEEILQMELRYKERGKV